MGGSGGKNKKRVFNQPIPSLSHLYLSNICLSDRHRLTFSSLPTKQLVDAHGMEVSSVYFRRLLATNASQIFPNAPRTATAAASLSTSASSATTTTPTSTTANTTDAGGTYQLLLGEMQKLTRSPQQAYKIAAALDTTDGDIYRDFDLSTFMDHFRLDAVAKTTLALACRSVSKQDVRTKGVLFSLHFFRFISVTCRVALMSSSLYPLSSRADLSA